MESISRILAALERELCGDELRVSVEEEEGEMDRMDVEGEKAVRRRRREFEEERRGVKDWKRLGRVECIIAPPGRGRESWSGS